MFCVHGTWVPDETDEFVRRGAFYLWVETDDPSPSRRRRAEPVHPRHLAGDALAGFLTERLRIRPSPYAAPPVRHFRTLSLLLPSASGAPLPSHELLPYLDLELPDEAPPAWWMVAAYPLEQPISDLRDIHFVALSGAGDFQLGADLLFWHSYGQTLRTVLMRDQYIPAMRYRVVEGAGAKRPARDASSEFYYGWEILSGAYEAALARYAEAMPPVCAAAAHAPGDQTRYAPVPLLRHFSECMAYRIVLSTPFSQAFEQRVAGTLLHHCIFPYRPSELAYDRDALLERYKQWTAWRAGLTSTEAAAGFTLCFRLEEAQADHQDDWRLHFEVAARDDPSHMLPLAEYWELPARAQGDLARSFGADFERHLLVALGHAARIYPTLWSGMATDRPGACRLSLEQAHAFLTESAWVLEDAGYRVIVPAWWTPEGRRRARVRLKTSLRPKSGSASVASGRLSMDSLVAYSAQLSIGGEPISEAEFAALVNAKTPLVRFRGQWMELDRARMAEMLAFWQSRRQANPELTLLDVLQLAGEADDDLEWDHDDAVAAMLSRLQDKSAFAPISDPPDLRGSLRDYQKRGVAWLTYLDNLGLGPCLADDMGLGKTVQVIAHMLGETASPDGASPTLIIAPTSVLGNWRKEIERFAPRLRVHVHQGAARKKDEKDFAALCAETDVVLTSYALVRLDEKLLRGQHWRRVVIDEAQNIKNPQAAQTRAITKLPAQRRLALTGTPVENRLRDLWSIFNFLNPGYLGREAQFRKGFETPIQKENDAAKSAALKRLVEPFILRRLKTDKRIIDDLPDKIEQKLYTNLTPEQASLYEAVVRDVEEQLDEAEGMGRRGLILATLMKLKQICNHPAQFLQDGSAFTPERSLKLSRLAEMTQEAVDAGESLLVFTQFTEIGSALDRYVAHTLHLPTFYLHGGTSPARRDRMVAEFQDPEGEPAVFILSLKAGGVGLNLTRASHVFHFDRWWNPAVEDQATDRAFRIGQRKNVFVRKFVTIGTVEEKIDALIEDKKRISSAIVGADESWLTELDNDAFKDLIALRRGAVLE
jgi:SNF2 family DNA or RNA helicase